jgi:hypothetical protein
MAIGKERDRAPTIHPSSRSGQVEVYATQENGGQQPRLRTICRFWLVLIKTSQSYEPRLYSCCGLFKDCLVAVVASKETDQTLMQDRWIGHCYASL